MQTYVSIQLNLVINVEVSRFLTFECLTKHLCSTSWNHHTNGKCLLATRTNTSLTFCFGYVVVSHPLVLLVNICMAKHFLSEKVHQI